ncbi:MAG: hypothetical protein CMG34_04195 [Candidatus Marinimicrobia bacterium]|nr:hypothetical protein [Candidatus Neomarinimicrobiota bacterium]
MKSNNNKSMRIVQLAVLIGLIVYNYTALLNIDSASDKISYIDNKIELSNYESMKIPGLLSANNKYVSYIEKIAKQVEGDIEYLESLDKIKDICKKNNLSVVELTSDLKNNLNAPQGAFENYSRTIERYEINLKVKGAFLNIGKLMDQLLELEYLVNSMKLDQSSGSSVAAYFTIYQYLSKPLNSGEFLTINFDKVLKSTPVAAMQESIPSGLIWNRDIFRKQKKNVKVNPNTRAYYLTNVKLTPEPTVIINGKTYREGSIIDIFTIKDITNKSVTLSGDRKSIILQLEKDSPLITNTNTFKEAFIRARRSGQAYFEYKGKLYSTDLN